LVGVGGNHHNVLRAASACYIYDPGDVGFVEHGIIYNV